MQRWKLGLHWYHWDPGNHAERMHGQVLSAKRSSESRWASWLTCYPLFLLEKRLSFDSWLGLWVHQQYRRVNQQSKLPFHIQSKRSRDVNRCRYERIMIVLISFWKYFRDKDRSSKNRVKSADRPWLASLSHAGLEGKFRVLLPREHSEARERAQHACWWIFFLGLFIMDAKGSCVLLPGCGLRVGECIYIPCLSASQQPLRTTSREVASI